MILDNDERTFSVLQISGKHRKTDGRTSITVKSYEFAVPSICVTY